MRYQPILIFLAAMSLFNTSANAGVIWTLNNFLFADETTVVGEFVWDSDSSSILTWDLQTSTLLNGPTDSPSQYTNATGSAATATTAGGVVLQFIEDSWVIRIGLPSLTVLDTPVSNLSLLGLGGLTGDNGFLECRDCSPFRSGNSGAFLSANASQDPEPDTDVPAPATLALIGLGLAGLGWRRRRI